jgi:NADPH:quinone reductase-like Zn-dependent oxidoreductase
VNFADILARMGLYPGSPRPPAVIGYEVAGRVDALGPGVTVPVAGERVMAVTRFGGYADTVIVPSTSAFRVPAGLSDAEAAAIPVNYLTAIVALYKLANLSPGETVLVHGAGGGVGIAAIQLARLRRARIIGTASAMKHDALRSFGVEHAIDYRTADVEHEVKRFTQGRGVDVILDPLGGRSFAKSYRLLAPLGRLVVYGVSSIAAGERRSLWHLVREWAAMPVFSPLSMINRNRGVIGLHLGHLWSETRQLALAMDQLLGEFGAGRLSPVLSKCFPLDRARDAHRFIQSRGNIGKVVLTT